MTISFTPAPTLPSLNDPANFNSRALALFSWLTGTHIAEQEGLNAADFFSVLGTVSQSGGVPTGAIIERGSNANGEYVRLADGTQVCTHFLALSGGGNVTITGAWVFPAPFIAKPKVSAVSEVAPPAGTRERGYWFGGSATGVNINASMNVNWPASTSEIHAATAIGRWF